MTIKDNNKKSDCTNQSCDCKESKDSDNIKLDSETKKDDEKKLDPTHFGDWQVGCRTIDF